MKLIKFIKAAYTYIKAKREFKRLVNDMDKIDFDKHNDRELMK